MSEPTEIKLTALVIEPDAQARARIKQGTMMVPAFARVVPFPDMNGAHARLKSQDPCDVVFLSYRLGHEEIVSFIAGAKQLPQGQDAAYVLVLKHGESSGNIASNIMAGVDGMIFEPFSVDQLIEITKLVTRVRKERTGARLEAALRIMMADVIKFVDYLSALKANGQDPGRALARFKELCSVLKSLDQDGMSAYYRIAIENFESVPVPRKPKAYAGASSRVKKKVEEKNLSELGKELGVPDLPES